MEFNKVIQSRRSIRKFKSDPVPDGYIKELLEAARLAPSGINLQPWRFVVVKSEAVRANLAQATPSTMIAKAPVVIVCCVDTKTFETAGIRTQELQKAGAFLDTPFQEYDAGDFFKNKDINEFWLKANLAFNAAIAIEHINLKATDLGLGSCWIGSFDQEEVREAIALDVRYDIIALMAIGYPEVVPDPRPRLTLDEILLKEIS
jgi:nitroreductase